MTCSSSVRSSQESAMLMDQAILIWYFQNVREIADDAKQAGGRRSQLAKAEAATSTPPAIHCIHTLL